MEAAFSPELEFSQEKEIEAILFQMGLSDIRIQADRAEIVDLWSAFSTRRYALAEPALCAYGNGGFRGPDKISS